MTDGAPEIPINNAMLRDAQGRLLPGSGGRPKGSRNRVSVQAIAKIRELTDDAFVALAENVQKGDQRAVEYVLDKVIPQGRLIELEAATPAAVAEALVSGQLSPEETKHISTALAKLSELEDLAAVKQRLVQIEALLRGDQ
jgi:hypothetical protein